MDYLIHIDTVTMELSILYFKGLRVKFSKKMMYIFYVPKDCFILANSANLDKMSPYMAFHLSLQHLPKYLFTGRMKRG